MGCVQPEGLTSQFKTKKLDPHVNGECDSNSENACVSCKRRRQQQSEGDIENDNQWQRKTTEHLGTHGWSNNIKVFLTNYPPDRKNCWQDASFRRQVMKSAFDALQKSQVLDQSPLTSRAQSCLQEELDDILLEETLDNSELDSQGYQRPNTIINDFNDSQYTDPCKLESLLIYKDVTGAILDQLTKTPLNPLCNILTIFFNYFKLKYGSIISQNTLKQSTGYLSGSSSYSQLSLEPMVNLRSNTEVEMKRDFFFSCQYGYDNQNKVNNMTSDLKLFMNYLYHTVLYYYELQQFQSISSLTDSYFTSQNITNFICSIMFQNETLHQIIYDNYLKLDEEYLNTYKESLQKYIYKSASQLGVPIHLQLNSDTIHDYNQKYSENLSVQVKSQYLIPFAQVCVILQQLNRTRSPVHQLKIFSKAFKLIDQCIKEFYYAHGMSTKKLQDADQLLSIFTYILIQSQINIIPTYCKVIETFIMKSVMSSQSGYILITVQSCVHYIATYQEE